MIQGLAVGLTLLKGLFEQCLTKTIWVIGGEMVGDNNTLRRQNEVKIQWIFVGRIDDIRPLKRF